MARGCGGRRAGVVGHDLVARHGERDAEVVRLVEAVGADRVAVGAVGHGADGRAHRALGAARRARRPGPRARRGGTPPGAPRTRLSISSLALTCAQMSPTVWSGVRTLARRSDTSVSSVRPSRISFDERDVEALLEQLARLDGADAAADVGHVRRGGGEGHEAGPPWKIGLSTQTSLMCPVPIHGSLVISTSPGRMPSAPIAARKWRTVAGSVPMNDGMLPVFWASARPRASVSTQAKSLASLESVENEVRTMAFAASSTIEMSRVQSTSSVIASKRGVSWPSPRGSPPPGSTIRLPLAATCARRARARPRAWSPPPPPPRARRSSSPTPRR